MDQPASNALFGHRDGAVGAGATPRFILILAGVFERYPTLAVRSRPSRAPWWVPAQLGLLEMTAIGAHQ